MMRRSCLAGLLFVFAIVLAFSGCSEKATSPQTGDPNSSDFLNMRAAIATSVDSTLASVYRFAGAPTKLFPPDTVNLRPELGIMNPEDSVLYNYVDGWNILYIGLTTGVEYNRVCVDSARFLENGVVYPGFSYHTTAMDYIRHRTDVHKGTGNTYQNHEQYVDVNYTNYQTSDAQLQGVGKFVLDDYYVKQAQGTHDKYTLGVTFSQIGYIMASGQPWTSIATTSGGLTLNGTVITGSVTSSWSVNVTFGSNGAGHVQATTGNTVYNYDMTPAYR